MRFFAAAVCFLALPVSVAASDAPASKSRSLMTPAPHTTERAQVGDLRLGGATMNPDILDALARGDSKEAAITLFEDVSFRAVVNRIDFQSPQSYSFGAQLETDGGTAVFVRDHDVILGHIWSASGAVYEIKANGADATVRQVDTSRFPDCGLTEQELAHADPLLDAPTEGVVCVDDGSEIRIFVAYTPASLAGIGGPAQMGAFANMCIAATNQAYANSGINTRAVLAGVSVVELTESGDGHLDRDRLTNPNDGFADNIHELRNQARADVVSTILENISGACGVANFSMTFGPNAHPGLAFNVTRRDCAVSNLSFPHELGHNQGSRHDRAADPSNGAYTYSHGFIAPNSAFRTVMATSNLAPPRIPYFSNPDVMFGGQPTGIADGSPNSADNARSINNTAIYVANFRVDECVPPGDLNQDSHVNGVDLAILLSLWGPGGSAADFNGDGEVNGVDLSFLLANWTG